MRRGLVVGVVLGLVLLTGPTVRAQRVNKFDVRQVEAALVLDSGALRVRLTLATGQALDYEVRDEGTIDKVLRFIDVGSNGGNGLAAEISTDGRTLRALHLVSDIRGRR